MPQTLAAPCSSEMIIRKSRFVGCVQPITDRAQAQQAVRALWQQHPAATHVCWALLAGGQSAAVDDGEPSGTAGRPMLEVLRHQDLDGVLATVVRWYGGIPLGAGGLVRAYTDAVAQALLQAQKVPMVRQCILRCLVPYALEGMLRRELARAGATLLSVVHGDAVEFSFRIDEPRRAGLLQVVNEGGQGRLVWLASAAFQPSKP